jgi:hypothetical protein
MFAQLQNVDAIHIKDVLLILIALVGMGSMIAGLVKKPKTSIEPQPLDVRIASEMVTKDYCRSSHVDSSARIARVEADVAALRQEIRDDRLKSTERISNEVGKVHDRVNDVLEAVSELRGRLDEVAART